MRSRVLVLECAPSCAARARRAPLQVARVKLRIAMMARESAMVRVEIESGRVTRLVAAIGSRQMLIRLLQRI